MLRYAFKEWAVITHALATGQQALILRKGGIADEGGIFRPDHDRFWLYPTYVHQQATGVQPTLATWFATMPTRPPRGNGVFDALCHGPAGVSLHRYGNVGSIGPVASVVGGDGRAAFSLSHTRFIRVAGARVCVGNTFGSARLT